VDIAENRGVKPRKLQNEVVRRQEIIEWMDEQGIDHYERVGEIAGDYYRNPQTVLDRIEQGD
ncbi:MAG: hypothetical protein ABEI97_01495, partial [Candidatus Nanohaloarchaea archaeon]